MNNRRKYWIFCLDTARITESIIKKTPSKNRNCLLLLGILAVEYCCRFSLIFSYPKLNCKSGERKSSMIYSCDVKLAFFIEFYRVLCSQIWLFSCSPLCGVHFCRIKRFLNGIYRYLKQHFLLFYIIDEDAWASV